VALSTATLVTFGKHWAVTHDQLGEAAFILGSIHNPLRINSDVSELGTIAVPSQNALSSMAGIIVRIANGHNGILGWQCD
jgi:hypothetical protein